MKDWPEIVNENFFEQENQYVFFYYSLYNELTIDINRISYLAKKNYLPTESIVHALALGCFKNGLIENAITLLECFLGKTLEKRLSALYLNMLTLSNNHNFEYIDKLTDQWNIQFLSEYRSIFENKFSIDYNCKMKKKVIGVFCISIVCFEFSTFFSDLFNKLFDYGFRVVLILYGTVCPNILKNSNLIVIPTFNLDPYHISKLFYENSVGIIIDILGKLHSKTPIEAYTILSDMPKICFGCNFTNYRIPGFYKLTNTSGKLSNTEKSITDNSIISIETILTSNVSINRNYTSPFLLRNNRLFVFASFEPLYKLNNAVLNCWMKILKSVDNSCLYIKSSGATQKAFIKRISTYLEQYELPETKVCLENVGSNENLLASYDVVDLYLNTFPCAADKQILLPLSKGIPCITYISNISNLIGYSISQQILLDLGLNSLVANSLDEYVRTAIYLATNIDALVNIRRVILDNISSDSLLYNPSKFTAAFAESLSDFFHL